MKSRTTWSRFLCLAAFACLFCLSACGSKGSPTSQSVDSSADNLPYIISIIDEPDTTDFQQTTTHYTIALNVFDRLVEMETTPDGTITVNPSLAKSWEVTDDGTTYTFHLREGVHFSNGSPLTSSDVRYTFVRLLTHPNSCNQDIVQNILGAEDLISGKVDDLKGFQILDDTTFRITLGQPFSAFLACLCMPGASILDQQTTEQFDDCFGIDPEATIGTGPFVFDEWRNQDRILLKPNKTYWNEPSMTNGLDLRFVDDPELLDEMIKNGELDIINLDDLGDLSDYYLHGTSDLGRVVTAKHIGIDFIALNESVKPLDDVRVRKALQLALDRQALLDAVYNGAGRLENGIFPYGLYGYNPEIAPISYDPKRAKELLKEAGLSDGFDLAVSMRATSSQWQRQLIEIAKSMWEEIGARVSIRILSEKDFMNQRTSGNLVCYTASWAADYDDPDNFIFTFFGTPENTRFRSLCYTDTNIMQRVRNARAITDAQKRLQEYHELEHRIVQDDAAWIPLFSRDRHFLVSNRVENFTTSWNGWFETSYKYMSIRKS